METKRQYLTVDEIAKKFAFTPQYIRSLIKKGTIPAEMYGNTWLIKSKLLKDKQIVFSLEKNVKDQQRKESKLPKIIALSFFSGAMGLDIGLSKAGINVLLASEIEPNARKTILLNEPNIGLIGDINNYSAKEIRKYANINDDVDIDLVVGGPPCQAFSTAGKREAFNDIRGNVFLTFIDRILELRPKYAVIENVRGLLSAAFNPPINKKFGFSCPTPNVEKGGALAYIVKKLEKGGYTVSFNLYNSANYGAPQKRERIVIICSREKKTIPYLEPTHSENGSFGLPRWRTISDVLKNIKEEEQEYLSFPEKRLKFYRLLKAGQCWKNLPLNIQKEAMGSKLNLGGGKTGFFRRLAWDKPSPTLVTDPTMPATDLGHPERNRPLSIQEYKRIQEFPDKWIIFGSLKDKYKQVGNAVPISLGSAIGKHIIKLLTKKGIKEISNFPYSRYQNTNEKTFMEIQLKKQDVDQLKFSFLG